MWIDVDAQLVARKLNEAFSNDDLWTSPSIVDDVEDLADEYDALTVENAKLRRHLEILRDHGIEIVDAVAGGFEIYSKDHALVDQLRELVRDMMRYYFTPSALDRQREVELTERARELGVEEDDSEHCSELGIEVG